MDIFTKINLQKQQKNIAEEYSDYLNKSHITTSMHFRLGDYKKVSDFHPISTYEYYERSLQYIHDKNPTQKFTVLYFCEEEDDEIVLVTINNLKNKFPDYEFIKGENSLDDWEQLLLMSCCHHDIIANSSFSWWAAYFNSSKDKIVCYPSIWFGSHANIDTRDLCPDNWIKIDV